MVCRSPPVLIRSAAASSGGTERGGGREFPKIVLLQCLDLLYIPRGPRSATLPLDPHHLLVPFELLLHHFLLLLRCKEKKNRGVCGKGAQ